MVHGQQTFVLSWSQTEIDGLRGRPVASVEIGSIWRWSGQAAPVGGPMGDGPFAAAAPDAPDLSHTIRSIRNLVGSSFVRGRLSEGSDIEDASLERFLVFGDGPRRFTADLVDMAELARPLLLFQDDLPPSNTDLVIVHAAIDARGLAASAAALGPPPLSDYGLRRAGPVGGHH